jgi:hypothetical protein
MVPDAAHSALKKHSAATLLTLSTGLDWGKGKDAKNRLQREKEPEVEKGCSKLQQQGWASGVCERRLW